MRMTALDYQFARAEEAVADFHRAINAFRLEMRVMNWALGIGMLVILARF